MPEQRVRFRDVKPYYTVDSLSELDGPSTGLIRLPVTIWWSSYNDTFDLDDPTDQKSAYSAVLTNGLPQDLRKYLHQDLLLEQWPNLRLDRRIVDLWANTHPEIARLPSWWTRP